MAEIRFNYGDKFTQTSDSNTGIGSTIPAAKLDIAGGTSAGSLRVSGIATLSSYQGFVNTKFTSTDNITVDAGQSGSVSGEVVVSTGQTTSVSTGATTGQGGIQSLKVYETFMPPVGRTADRPTDVKPGMVYYNKDFKTIEFWDGNFWRQVDNTTTRGRGIWMCGFSPNYTSNIGFINIQSKGNEQAFGESVNGVAINKAGSANAIRGIWGGEQNPSGYSTDMDYVTMASEGNSIDFGDLTQARPTYGGSFASSTRAIWAGGYASGSAVNTMDYVQIMTIGNALDFGDLHTAVFNQHACSSPTKGFIISGSPSSFSNYQISTIASKGSTELGGEMTISFGSSAACSNSTRAVVFGGGSPPVDTIDLINLSTEGNAVSFGTLSDVRMLGAACADGTRAVCVSGRNPSVVNTIEFIQIATGGSSEDFGDMTQPSAGRQKFMACSDSHGGLGGF
jgi:hypothetical protein